MAFRCHGMPRRVRSSRRVNAICSRLGSVLGYGLTAVSLVKSYHRVLPTLVVLTVFRIRHKDWKKYDIFPISSSPSCRTCELTPSSPWRGLLLGGTPTVTPVQLGVSSDWQLRPRSRL